MAISQLHRQSATTPSLATHAADGVAGRHCRELCSDTHVAVAYKTRNRKHRRASAKLAACAKPLMLATVERKEKREGG